jgi:hypothetical protein
MHIYIFATSCKCTFLTLRQKCLFLLPLLSSEGHNSLGQSGQAFLIAPVASVIIYWIAGTLLYLSWLPFWACLLVYDWLGSVWEPYLFIIGCP